MTSAEFVTRPRFARGGAGRSLGAVACALALALASMVSCGEYFILPGAAGDGGGALTDGGMDAQRGDAGSTAPDAGASSDATTGPDAGDARSTDAGSSPCIAPLPGTVFCDDFDTAAFGALWDAAAPAPAPALKLVSDVSKSAPSSLEAVATSGGSVDQARVLDTRLPVDAGADIHVTLDLRIDKVGGAYPFGVVLHGASDLFLSLNLDNTSIEEIVKKNDVKTDTPPPYVADGGIPPGEWVGVDLYIHRADGGLELKVAGVRVLSATIKNVDLLRNEDCHLRVGLYYAGKNVDWRAHIDNVVVRTQ